MSRPIARVEFDPEIGVALQMERADEGFLAMQEGRKHWKTVVTRYDRHIARPGPWTIPDYSTYIQYEQRATQTGLDPLSLKRPAPGDPGGEPALRGPARHRPAHHPVLPPAVLEGRGGGAAAGPRRAAVPRRDDDHPQPAPSHRRRLGGRPPWRRPAREAGPPDRRRGGQVARGPPGVGAGPAAIALAPPGGNRVELDGRPPHTDPAGRRGEINFV